MQLCWVAYGGNGSLLFGADFFFLGGGGWGVGVVGCLEEGGI